MSVFQQHLSVIADMKTGLITHNHANWNDFATSPMAAACRRCVCVARRVPKKTATATATAMPMMTPRFSKSRSRLASRLTRARIAVLYSKHCATRTVQELEGTRRLQSSHAVCCAVARVGPAP